MYLAFVLSISAGSVFDQRWTSRVASEFGGCGSRIQRGAFQGSSRMRTLRNSTASPCPANPKCPRERSLPGCGVPFIYSVTFRKIGVSRLRYRLARREWSTHRRSLPGNSIPQHPVQITALGGRHTVSRPVSLPWVEGLDTWGARCPAPEARTSLRMPYRLHRDNESQVRYSRLAEVGTRNEQQSWRTLSECRWCRRCAVCNAARHGRFRSYPSALPSHRNFFR